ncbi:MULTISPECIES: OmpP1/FadL family transporter [unclassified Flavobacterium]|jgi:long-chain fatty acid transport protein|uniref:OmpP1/FadL family transporter n=1 Tax=unclassified Flavobacterium TaxID=196869 RepID=UPI0025B89C2A|nr:MULTISPECIES: outer membrane protein transport protein [unclassified Flavobacterium]
MKKFLTLFVILISASLFAQVGHLMQGIGAVNMSMGGAATAQPLDINSALYWNPAALSVFDGKILTVNAGLFFSAPELSSTVPTPSGPFSGVTKNDKGVSIMPSVAYVWGKEKSKHTYGISAFGISGFGVNFPENMSNPINMPQSYGGFGQIKSDYMLFQVGFSYAYKISDKFSVGFTPTINLAGLQLAPNPTASPTMAGYPSTNKAYTLGYGGQLGIFYQNGAGFKLGANYKSPQFFSDFKFKNTYLDGSKGDNSFNMNFPAIYSIGTGYSTSQFDLALDFRYVDYKNTKGFDKSGWTPTNSVSGFGWDDIQVVSFGVQYKGISKLPLRAGYTFSSNPIKPELAFFSTPATAIIKNAYQLGCGYEFSKKATINAVFHYGTSDGATSGPMNNPMMVSPSNPLGAVPGSNISYDMTTKMIMVGLTYKLN